MACTCDVVCVVVLNESPCPRGSLRTNLQVLVLWPQSPWKFSRTSHSANCPLCVIVCTCDVHKFCYCHWAWGYGKECLTYWCHILYLLIYVSKKVFVLVFEDQFTSSCPRAISPWIQQVHRVPKKGATKLMVVTSSNLNQSSIFHHWKEKEISNKIHILFPPHLNIVAALPLE